VILQTLAEPAAYKLPAASSAGAPASMPELTTFWVPLGRILRVLSFPVSSTQMLPLGPTTIPLIAPNIGPSGAFPE
jgi:hypothetical protein